MFKREPLKVVEKPWGKELWIGVTHSYAFKIIKVNKGARFSLQYHKKKEETVYILKGKIRYTIEDESGNLQQEILKEGDIIDIPANRKHRGESIGNCALIEVSTPHLDDLIRVEDHYSR